jgi:hypothetical protein
MNFGPCAYINIHRKPINTSSLIWKKKLRVTTRGKGVGGGQGGEMTQTTYAHVNK